MNRLWPILIFPLVIGMSTIVTGADGTAENVKHGAIERTETTPQSYLFAVIGQVAHPGVYRAPMSDPLLVDLIHNTGGLTDKASGYLRIVRRGPNGYRALYAGNPKVHLRPGDVVVAERAAFQPMTSRLAGFSGAANNVALSRPPLPPFVQIVFINLIDRPVVLKMSRETATVSQILTLLGQSSELASTVKVIPPFHPSTPAPHSTQFSSPTVLVFDRSLLNTDQIPDLPAAVINDALQPQQAAGKIHPVPVPNAEVDTVPPREISAAGHLNERVETQSPPIPSGVSPEKGLSDLVVDEAEILLPLRTAGSRKSRNDISSIETAATPLPLSPAASKPIVLPAQEKADLPGVSPLGGYLALLLTIILSAVATAGIMLWLRRRKLARTGPLAAESTSSVEADNLLDDIINDELPVIEEPFELPTHLQLSSRIIGPVKIRLDAAHKPPRPHFLPVAQPVPVSPPIQESATQLEAVEPPRRAGQKIRFDTAKTTDTVARPVTVKRQAVKVQAAAGKPSGLLDRVLSTVHGATRK